jgi:nitroimidazol reductase NimA-like FMN-containing flavoprotein (pyridoxamine 5'-phosphate oxidase superfamily)
MRAIAPQAPRFDEVEELTPADCWSVLGAAQVGRLTVCADGSPHLFPINHVVDEQTIVFRTAPGSKLAASANADAAFEVDEYDVDSGHASSVIIEGRASEIAEAADWDRALGLPLFSWHVTPKGHFVRITPDSVSGRRFRPAYAAREGRG